MATTTLTQSAATICGVVQVLFHSGVNFSAGLLRTDAGPSLRFAGKVYVREGDAVSFEILSSEKGLKAEKVQRVNPAG